MREHFSNFLTTKINFFVRSMILEIIEKKLLSLKNFSDPSQVEVKFWGPSGIPWHGRQGWSQPPGAFNALFLLFVSS